MKKLTLLLLLTFASSSYAVTVEEFYILIQTTQNIEGLRNNMLENAVGYKSALANKLQTSDSLGKIMKQDADQYQRRLKWITNLLNSPSKNQKIQAAFDSVGISVGDLNASMAELGAASDALRNADVSDDDHINAISDSIIQSVGAHDKVF